MSVVACSERKLVEFLMGLFLVKTEVMIMTQQINEMT